MANVQEEIHEEWKDALNYEGLYQISNLGRAKRLPKQIVRNNGRVQTFNERLLSLPHDKDGYIQLSLSHKGVTEKKKAHRLVAESFIREMKAREEVNHKNGIKDDNRLVNLEIVTRSENEKHAYRELGKTNNAFLLGKPIIAYYIKPRASQKCKPEKDRIYKTYRSIAEAAKDVGALHPSSINSVCRGREKTALGFIWEYA